MLYPDGWTMGADPNEEDHQLRRLVAIGIEDVLILLSVGALFVLAVFFRDTVWGQVGLGAVFLVMVIVFIGRIRRANRAFTEHRDDPM